MRDMADSDTADVLLFSYGTLQQPEVQLTTFGRRLAGHGDAVLGHELDWVKIRDPHVIATSGSDRHPVLVESDRPAAAVEGTVFAITAAELAAADEYEVATTRASWFPSAPGGRPGSTRSRPRPCGTTRPDGRRASATTSGTTALRSPGARSARGRRRRRRGPPARSTHRRPR